MKKSISQNRGLNEEPCVDIPLLCLLPSAPFSHDHNQSQVRADRRPLLRRTSGLGLSSSSFGSLRRFGLGRFLGLLCCLATWGSFGITAIRGGPEGKVVAKKLHDKRAVAVGFLRKGIELCNCVVEGLLGQVASAVRRVQDLVVEDREVKGKAKTDGVGRSKLGLCNVGSILYCDEYTVNFA